MAVSDYCTPEFVTAYRRSTDTNELSIELIARLIPIVSRAIDTYCRRHFYARTDTEVYDYQSPRRLMLRGDLLSVTQITNGDDSVLPADSYLLYPLNGPPYRWIDLDTSVGMLFYVSGTRQRAISVTGSWGFLEDDGTPQPIQLACAAWCNYLSTVGKNAGIQSTTIGDYTESFGSLIESMRAGPPGEVASMLAYYRKRTIGSNLKW